MTTPAAPEIYMTSSKQILVTRDPVYTHPAIKDGRYIGRQPHSYLPFAIFVTIINPVLGPLAILFSVLSKRAYRDGDLPYSQKWSQYAMLAGCIIIVVSIVIYIAIWFSMVESCTIRQLGDGKYVEECNSGISGGHSY